MKHGGILLFCWIPGLLPLNANGAAATSSEQLDQPNCAATSLYLLSLLVERPLDLGRAIHSLYDSQSTIQDLMNVAHSQKIWLESRVLRKAGIPLDRPVIVFFQLPTEGHFAVLRPVGSYGKMVQLLDPPSSPRIIDYEDLFEDRWCLNAVEHPAS